MIFYSRLNYHLLIFINIVNNNFDCVNVVSLTIFALRTQYRKVVIVKLSCIIKKFKNINTQIIVKPYKHRLYINP